ncbi:unnamed protein product [Prunus armeniaca]|uniref:AAA+ ATPase domain-containing protein n=2 Tax=Prunus armeniaca TaxID=36596 RepID=A0A6J5XQZ8_PRUAR|nr:unnamed protein product [Prunus armeniaca]
MAEVVTFGVQEIVKKVASLASEEISLVWGFQGELTKLRESLLLTEAMLRDAGQSKEVRPEAVQIWVNKLEDIAHEADDVLDECGYELLRRQVEVRNQMKKKVLNFLSLHYNPILFRLKMAHKIENINSALENLNKKAASIGLVNKKFSDATSSREIAVDRETVSIFKRDEKNIVGREKIVSEIVTTLINSSNTQENENLPVMAIVGMAGLGKTTLAKCVYHEDEIGRRFTEKIWICVSIPFEVKSILSKILEHLKPEKARMQDKDAIIKNLQEDLKGKRYLLVLDDVWNEDSEKWNDLMSCLLSVKDTQGSNILVTTRSARVASISQTLSRYDLQKLSDDQCWLILKDRAFPNESDPTLNEDQERIGRDIAKKCGGIPLVAKVLGSMMQFKEIDGWRVIQESTIWDLPEEEKRISSVLKLSFDELTSPTLKQCFVYCSMFTKDFEIEKDDLIQLWMAQGLLHPSPNNSDLEMEDVGNQYFNILLENSFFQDVRMDYYYGTIIATCKIHDLVHDLAEDVSKSKTKGSNEIRHVPQNSTIDLQEIPKGIVHKVRSMFLKCEVLDNILPRFKGLRVLKLEESDVDVLPNSIGELKHLRYLDISATNVKKLPQSIGKLYNLQTLRMHELELEEFPKELQNLINLRHIHFEDWHADGRYPVGMGRLKNLRSLSFFIVGKERGRGIKELGGLKHLKGELSISDLKHVRDGEEAKEAKLAEKTNIRRLELEWSTDEDRSRVINNDRDVLEGLKPHSALESLEIRNFSGETFPPWMMCGDLFSSLKRLTVENAKNLTEWRTEEAAVFSTTEKRVVFSRLEELLLRNCDQLRSAPTDHFPCLQKLEIDSMNSGMPIANIISTQLTTLTRLTIKKIRGLVSLPEGMLKNNKNLAYLEIRDCPEFICIAADVYGCCASLESLRIYSRLNLEAIPITHGLPSLRQLKISFCAELSSLPNGLQHCTSLEHLSIINCWNLEAIPSLDSLTQLRELEICRCGGLKSLPPNAFAASLTQLKELEIGWFWEELDSFPVFQVIPQLETLSLWGWPKLSCLPKQVQCFTCLTSLTIHSFDGMEALPEWLRNLASLKILSIWKCKNLMYLPTLEAMKCLTKLQYIYIRNCPLLKERCNKDSGPEWPKISHIPNILCCLCDGPNILEICEPGWN